MAALDLLLVAALCFLLGLFVRDFLPSYARKKGENLATKEDIAKITELQEEVTRLRLKRIVTSAIT